MKIAFLLLFFVNINYAAVSTSPVHKLNLLSVHSVERKQGGSIENSFSVGSQEDNCSREDKMHTQKISPLKSEQQRPFQRTLYLLLCPPSDRPKAIDPPKLSFPH